MPGVQFVGPTDNMTKGGLLPANVRGVVCHIAEGYFLGTISWQKNPSADVSSHFIVDKDGTIVQMVDSSDRAWTQGAGNSTWLSIENVGFAGQSLTPEQVTANAKILLWVHRTFPNVPLQLASSPSGRGYGHHSMGYESGVAWGHQFCPGEPIKKQKAGIVALAITMKSGGGTVAEDVALTPAQDAAASRSWQFAEGGLTGNPLMAGTGGKGQPAQKRVWLVDTLIEIRDGVKALVGRPANDRIALTPTDHAEIGKATARALLELVTTPAAAQSYQDQAMAMQAPEVPGWDNAETEPRVDEQSAWFDPKTARPDR